MVVCRCNARLMLSGAVLLRILSKYGRYVINRVMHLMRIVLGLQGLQRLIT